MSIILDAWERQCLMYQKRYFETYIKLNKRLNNHLEKTNKETNMLYASTILEMSWVLSNIFGLSGKQIEEVERNAGFTNEDIDSPYIDSILQKGES